VRGSGHRRPALSRSVTRATAGLRHLNPTTPEPLNPSGPVVHPSALVGPLVVFGPDCKVAPFCHFEGRVTAGRRNRFGVGVAIGGAPMDTKYEGEDTEVRIGSGNAFFEYTTVHRASGTGNVTVIGDDNFVMAYVHIAHNCRVGDGCVITSGVQLGGHVEVGDRANIGGLTGIHQFCRVGTLAMVGACSYANKDVPPYMLAAGRPCRVRGLNSVGLRRAGIAESAVLLLRRAYRVIYRSGLNLTQALSAIETELLPQSESGHGREQLEELLSFIRSSERGVELRSGRQEQEEL
jgi:UDP-N-acetylglucosamine acyltransferase